MYHDVRVTLEAKVVSLQHALYFTPNRVNGFPNVERQNASSQSGCLKHALYFYSEPGDSFLHCGERECIGFYSNHIAAKRQTL